MEIVLSLPVGHFFNEEEISKTREEMLTNEGKQGYEQHKSGWLISIYEERNLATICNYVAY